MTVVRATRALSVLIARRKKNRCGDAYEDRRRKQKKLRVRVEDSHGAESDASTSDKCGISVVC